MYVAKYLLYSYWLITIGLGLLSATLIFYKCKSKKVKIINLQYKDSSSEIYTTLKSVGITLDEVQKQAFEEKIENKYSHKKLGFGRW